MKNKLICIGFLGYKKCYLNVTLDEAKRRYVEEDEGELDDFVTIKEIEFNDVFSAYDVWGV